MQSPASGGRSPEIEEESSVRAPAAAILSRRDTRKKVTYNEEVLAANELERDNTSDTLICAGEQPEREKVAGVIDVPAAADGEVVAIGGSATRALVHSMESSRKSLQGKKSCRRSTSINSLLPRGGGTLAMRVPRRLAFAEGKEGDDAHTGTPKLQVVCIA